MQELPEREFLCVLGKAHVRLFAVCLTSENGQPVYGAKGERRSLNPLLLKKPAKSLSFGGLRLCNMTDSDADASIDLTGASDSSKGHRQNCDSWDLFQKKPGRVHQAASQFQHNLQSV